MANYFSLNDAMTNEAASDIASSIKNSTPAPDKLKEIRKGYSNNFTYTLNFGTDNALSASVTIMEDGTIGSETLTNVATVAYYLNGEVVSLPFDVKEGDKVDAVITYTTPSTAATVKLIADEFKQVFRKRYSDYAPTKLEGLKCWIVPDAGIILNYQDTGESVETLISSTNIKSSSTGGLPYTFSDNDVGKHVKIVINSIEYYRVVISYDSGTSSVEVNESIPVTETEAIFYIGYVAQWDDISGNGVSFIQTTADKQPVLKDNVQNGLPSVFFEIPDYMTANKHIAYERTVYAVLQSTETATDTYSRLFFGDYVAGGTFFAEWANPTPQVLYGLNNNYKGSQSLIDGSSLIKTVRGGFHQVALRLSPEKGHLRVDETYIIQSTTNTGSVAPQSLFSIGSRGDQYSGCLGYITELLIYDRYHSDDEVLIIEKYLKDKYNL